MKYIKAIINDNFSSKVDRVSDRDYSVRYYREDDVVGVVRATLYESKGKVKPISQRSVIISSAQVGEMFTHLLPHIKEEDLMSLHEVLFSDVRDKILIYSDKNQPSV